MGETLVAASRQIGMLSGLCRLADRCFAGIPQPSLSTSQPSCESPLMLKAVSGRLDRLSSEDPRTVTCDIDEPDG